MAIGYVTCEMSFSDNCTNDYYWTLTGLNNDNQKTKQKYTKMYIFITHIGKIQVLCNSTNVISIEFYEELSEFKIQNCKL
jgi:hypothetical protein